MATPDIPNFGDGLSEGMKAGQFSGREVFQTVNQSLSQPLDVRAAHQFFAPSGNAGLPDLQTFGGESLNFSNQAINFNAGSELAFNGAQSLSFDAAPMAQLNIVPTGAEAAALAPGADAAIAALTPGAEPISPIIQLIMRMPGHIGLLNSFFEALGALFMPLQDFIGAFNFADWLNHANAGLASSLGKIGEHMPMSLSMLPSNAPIFATLGQHFGTMGLNTMGTNMAGQMSGQFTGFDTLASSSNNAMSQFPDFGDIPQADLNVGGHADFGQPGYQTMDPRIGNPHEMIGGGDSFVQGQQIAFDNGGGAFRPQLGGMQGAQSIPQAQMPQQQPAMQTQQTAGQQMDLPRTETTVQPQAVEQQPLLQQQGDAAAGQQVAQGPAEATPYTVKPGDNLWDIAKTHMGDGTKWPDIYKMNQDVVGSNPNLIHPGDQLNLGDSSHMTASADYTVKPGDNLWNISKDHLGGGQNWHHLYDRNTSVIGENPSLIHPGQKLSMPGGEHHATLADASGAHAAHPTAHHASGHHTTAHHSPAHHTNNHHTTAHHNSPEHHSQPAADKMAHAKPASAQPPQAVEASSQQVPQQLAQTPQGGAEQGLKASQSMGSLKDLKLTE
ncbi:MAG: LysM peptidoglycan-binding domain-containing protein [Candidatus Obscuribacterales bacterium]|nr:LysM peptidoglycan-binding domain-containing protein [Candidatus Obscuribacterales bacterium]